MDKLKVVGNKLIDQHGRPRMLRGANVIDWEWKYSWRETPEFELRAIPVLCGDPGLAAPQTQGWGANLVQFAVHSGPILRTEQKYLNGLDDIVDACHEAGTFLMLSYRAPEPNTQMPPGIPEDAMNAMGILANRYVGQEGLLWGAAVEPHDISWATLRPQLEKMVDVIRLHIPDAVVFCPGTQWARYVHWALNDPVQRDNVVYKVDFYGSFADADGSYKLAATAETYPVIMGEFGAGGQTSLEDTKKLLDYWEAHGMGYCAWSFSDEGSPRLLRSKTTFEPSTFGALLKPKLQEKYADSYPSEPLPPLPPEPPPVPVPTAKTYIITLGGMSLTFTTDIPITIQEL